MPSARAGKPAVASGKWQVRFDGGRQQRYLADREAVLRYVLAVGPHAASGRLAEVIDLGRPGEADRLRRELEVLGSAGPGSTPDPDGPEPPAMPPPPSPSLSTAGKPTVADGRP